jgi:hypothetical protein
VLVAGHIAGLRSGDGWFPPRAVLEVFDGLRVPRPGNVRSALSRLASAALVLRRSGGGEWSLTPLGRERVPQIVQGIDLRAVEAEMADVPGADLSDAPHAVIPPEFAPPRWQPAIARLLTRYPFDKNVFCMTRFPKSERETEMPDPVKGVIEVARAALSEYGLTLHLASDRNADDELFGNIAAHMWACRYGIALFETRSGDQLNDNVQIEVGGMLISGRRCALLKDRDTPSLPTDFVGHIYKPVDFDDLDAVRSVLHGWATGDLGIGPGSSAQ